MGGTKIGHYFSGFQSFLFLFPEHAVFAPVGSDLFLTLPRQRNALAACHTGMHNRANIFKRRSATPQNGLWLLAADQRPALLPSTVSCTKQEAYSVTRQLISINTKQRSVQAVDVADLSAQHFPQLCATSSSTFLQMFLPSTAPIMHGIFRSA